jgi:cupin 2 domain-containing protein
VSRDSVRTGNLFVGIPARLEEEETAVLAELPGARIERIVSIGQASPPGFWFDQDWTEWVIVLTGSAGLLIDGEADPRILAPGDWVEIPPHVRHRVNGPTPISRPSGSRCTLGEETGHERGVRRANGRRETAGRPARRSRH